MLGGVASVVAGSDDGPEVIVVASGGSVVLVDVEAGSVVVEASHVVGGAVVEAGSAESYDEQPIAIRLTTAPPTIEGPHAARMPTPARLMKPALSCGIKRSRGRPDRSPA